MKLIVQMAISLGFVLTFVACDYQESNVMNQENNGKKKIGVLIFDDVLTSDVTAPLEVFGYAQKDPNFEYQVLAISVESDRESRTYEGLRLQADYSIDEAPALDVLIVPGSYSLDDLYANADLMKFLKKQGGSAKYLASNCAGAFLLGRAGLLDGRRATTWKGGGEELQSTYPAIDVQRGQSIVEDDGLITSYGGIVSYAAAKLLLEKIATPEIAAKVSEAIYIDRLQDSRRAKSTAAAL